MSILNSTSKKTGILLSYCHLAIQTISTMVLTSVFVRMLGVDEYGFYQMIYSVANYILILDLGISATMVRFISEYRALGDRKREENFAAHMMIIIGIILVVVVCVGSIVNHNLGNMYSSLSSSDLSRAHAIFATMIFQIVITIISHYIQGIALSYERFSAVKIGNIFQVFLYFVSSIILVTVSSTSMSIVKANTLAISGATVLLLIYDISSIKFKIKWHGADWKMLFPAFTLMIAMLLQSIISYVNTSLDKTLLGIYTLKSDVAVYSIAATIITLYNAMPSAISGVFLPHVTRAVVSGADNTELTECVIRAGRYQYIICGAILGGFIAFGRDFISLWTGEHTSDAWIYALLIMIPNTIPLVQNVCLSILDAKNKRIFRSLILCGIVLSNIALSIFLIRRFGPIGAPLATGFCYFLGHGLVMNIYYQKKIGLQITRIFKTILPRTTIVMLVDSTICILIKSVVSCSNWYGFVINGVIFCVLYGITVFSFVLNKDEKQEIIGLIKRRGR